MKPKIGDTGHDMQQHCRTRFKSEIILLYKANSSSGHLYTQTDRTVPDAAHRHYL